MPFLNHLRRLSGFSFDTQASPHDSDASAHTSKSSPTLESPYDASTPASSIPPSLLNLNLPPPDSLESLPQPELLQPPESPESLESRRNSMMLGRLVCQAHHCHHHTHLTNIWRRLSQGVEPKTQCLYRNHLTCHILAIIVFPNL